MKENIKKIVKDYIRLINLKFIKNLIFGILGLFILSFILVSIYSFTFEKDKIAIDRYNFEQLEKVKIILKDLKRNDEQFFYLKDFNKIYNQNITPIKNCYYLRNYKSEDRVFYTFGFKLESLIYIYIYRTKHYAYPKYDIPYQNFCMGGKNGGCFDGNKISFDRTISNPCQD